jgi:hypothetical protein
MRRYFPVFVAMTLTASLGLPIAASAQAAPPCPGEPANAVAVTADPASLGMGLTNIAVTAATQAAQKAGLVPVAGAAPTSVPVFTPFGTVRPAGPAVGAGCVPTLALAVSTDIPQAITLYVTRYTERVTVTATITMPDGRISRGSQSTTVSWYAGYAPVPYTPGLPISGIPITTSQNAAEQRAVQRVAAELAMHAAAIIRGAAPGTQAPAP